MNPKIQPSWRHAAGLALGLVAAAGLLGAQVVAPTPERLEAKARSVLHQVMESEHSWIRIHAAEALLAAGEADTVRAYFLRESPSTESSVFRIGVWRVLATAAESPEERSKWIAKIEQVFLDSTAPDQNQAIETLGKLGHRVTGEALFKVRQNAAGPPGTPLALALWSGQLAGEPRALDGLAALLTSDDPALRTSAAYALRWLHPSDPRVRAALAQAVAVEPAGTTPSAYLLGAALAVEADPRQAANWVAQLDEILLAATASVGARFEASWTLQHRYQVSDLARVAPLLDLPPGENDTRVGAAMIILTTLARP